MTAMSTSRAARSANAIAVVASKKLASSRSMCSLSCVVHSAKASSPIGMPSTVMRSQGEMRCGDEYSPTRQPCARSSPATKAQVEPFPFVPPMWTVG
jgi:hypothetical protein